MAIATTGTRTWKLVKAHYLAAALGAALALSAVVGAGSLKSVDFGGSSGRVATTPAEPAIRLASVEPVTIYIAGSQAQADQIIAGENQAAMEAGLAGYGSQVLQLRHVEVFVIDTPEREAQLQIALGEATQANSNTQFIDLRSR